MPVKPARVKITAFGGRTRSLTSGPDAFERLCGQGAYLFLGLGPDPDTAFSLAGKATARYVECPEFESQMPDAWHRAVPTGWERLTPEDLTPDVVRGGTILFFRQNLSLFPDFWAPVLARVRKRLRRTSAVRPGPRILYAHGAHELLTVEITSAMQAGGFEVQTLPPDADHETLMTAAEDGAGLFFSLNFHGLDRYGRNFHLLRESEIPVLTWCVDNPLHILSGIESDFWKQMHVLVTDPWFVLPLRELGGRVDFLPLATDPGFFSPRKDVSAPVREAVFVGRSRFPERDRFFAGSSVPMDLAAEAGRMLEGGGRPDFSWWWRSLGRPPLWPGSAVRSVGFGAEQCSRAWRERILSDVGRKVRLEIVGDKGWRDGLGPEIPILSPVDYYHGLAEIYGRSMLTVNATSLLLPHGLNQRHFDVWAAGGFLLTDKTPGLDLFPASLTKPITFSTAQQAADMARELAADPTRREEIAQAWKEEILRAHTYAHRVRSLLDAAGVS